MIEPRAVVLRLGDLPRLTILEQARARVLAGVNEAEGTRLVAAALAGTTRAEDELALFTLLYAFRFELERRTAPETTWAEAQTWALEFDRSSPPDELAEAEERAVVRAAVVTGLPLVEAGEVTLAQLDEYREVHEEQAKAIERARRR